MPSPIAITADYVNLRFVQGRKVAQVVLEIPQELANKFIEGFGAPDAASPVKVAIARLLVGNGPDSLIAPDAEAQGPGKPRTPFDQLSPTTQSAIRCDDPAFQEWVGVIEELRGTKDGTEIAKKHVHAKCMVMSRRELSTNPKAAELWARMNTSFEMRSYATR